MRLFYLSDSTLPSTDANAVQVMRMAQAFSLSGASVTLVARRGGGSSPAQSLFKDYGVKPLFCLHRLPYFRLRGMNRAYGFSAAFLARTRRADAAYCRCLQSARGAARFRLPVFYELHSLPAVGSRADRQWLPALLAHPQCRGLIAITELLRDDLRARYDVPAERIIVAADGADGPPPGIQPALAGTNRLRVGFTGQLYPGKGMEIILPLARACAWADFHVVGGREPDLRSWRDRAAGLTNLTFHGYVKPAAVAGFLASFDVLLLPNQREVLSCGGSDIGRWTSPLKLFEYMAAGKAILASDLPVLREVLEPEVNAILCDPSNLGAWIDALRRLRDDSKLRACFGTAAAHDFRASYSWTSRAHLLLHQMRIWLGERAPTALQSKLLRRYEPMRIVESGASNSRGAIHLPVPPSS